MREAAAVIDGDNLVSEGVYEEWDADMIHGCLCDEGWEGYDCSLRYGCQSQWGLFGGLAGRKKPNMLRSKAKDDGAQCFPQ